MSEFMMSVKGDKVEAWKDGEPIELSKATMDGLLELSARQEALSVESEKIHRKQDSLLRGQADDDDVEVFDWSLYSALIRKARKDMGFKTAEAFSATIYRRTRVKISRDSIYKIEQGKQTPDAMQFMAINMVLYNEPFPGRIVTSCLCPEWVQIMNGGDIPLSWKHGNYRDALEAMGHGEDGDGKHPGVSFVATVTGDSQYLFEDDEIPF